MIACAVIQKLRFEEVPRVSYSGGIFSAGELVLKPLRAAMDVPTAFQPPLPDPAESAVLLAAERYSPRDVSRLRKALMENGGCAP